MSYQLLINQLLLINSVTVFSRKVCGTDFLKGFLDGRISLDFLDFGTYYNNQDNFMVFRDEGARTSLTYQFFVSGGGLHLPITEDIGNKKRDQVIINYSGIDQVTLP